MTKKHHPEVVAAECKICGGPARCITNQGFRIVCNGCNINEENCTCKGKKGSGPTL